MAIQRLIVDVLMLDGVEFHDVVITTADRLKYGTTARKHKWGQSHEEPERFATFCAWAALARTGLYAGAWEQFVADSEAVAPQEAPDTVDPTTTATPSA